MKINLSLNSPLILSDYVNVDPLVNDPEKTYGKLDDLSMIVDDGEAEEIRAMGILSYFSHRAVPSIVQGWARKLRHGGILIVSDSDLNTVIRSFTSKKIDHSQLNDTLMGLQTAPYLFRKCLISCEMIKKLLTECGLKIEYVEYTDYDFIIKASRP